MNKKLLRTVLPIVVLVVLVLAGIWYTRPMTIAQLAPELDREQPATLIASGRIWHDDLETEYFSLTLSKGDPLYEEARELLSQIRIKRTLGSAVQDLTGSSSILEEGDVVWTLHLDGAAFGLQFHGGDFYYTSFSTNGYRHCTVENYNETTQALNAFLLEHGVFSDNES